MEERNEIADLEIRIKIAALNINKFTMYSDPSHGWLEVPLSLIELLSIEEMITECSYQSRDQKMIYLEQDVDASAFLSAYCDIMGITGGRFSQ